MRASISAKLAKAKWDLIVFSGDPQFVEGAVVRGLLSLGTPRRGSVRIHSRPETFLDCGRVRHTHCGSPPWAKARKSGAKPRVSIGVADPGAPNQFAGTRSLVSPGLSMCWSGVHLCRVPLAASRM